MASWREQIKATWQELRGWPAWLLLVWLLLAALAETRAGFMTIGEFTMVCTLSANVVMVVRLLGRRMVDFFADYGSFRDGVELIDFDGRLKDVMAPQDVRFQRTTCLRPRTFGIGKGR